MKKLLYLFLIVYWIVILLIVSSFIGLIIAIVIFANNRTTDSHTLFYSHKPELYYSTVWNKYLKVSQTNELFYIGIADNPEVLKGYDIICPDDIDYLKIPKDNGTVYKTFFIGIPDSDTLYVMSDFNSVSIPMKFVTDSCNLSENNCSFWLLWPKNNDGKQRIIKDQGLNLELTQ